MRGPEGLDSKSSMEAQRSYHSRCHVAMEKLADKWDQIGADVAVILGNDQNEIYETDQLNPPFMVFFGDTIPNYPQSEEDKKCLPPGVAEAEHGHATDVYTEYRGIPELGSHLIKTLTEREFDVAASKVWPKHARNGASHAFGHIYRQVMRDKVVPNVPVYQNTFFPPNQPTAKRSYQFGRVIKEAIESWPSDKRVAVFASGGMSHFVIDEEFDRKFVAALKAETGLSHLNSTEGASVRNVGAEVLDFARGPARGYERRDARDRLCAVLSFAGWYRHGEWVLLVGHERPMSSVAEFVARLRKVDCCAVSDALDSLNLKGAVSGLLQRSARARIAGQVITVKLGIGAPPGGPPRRLCTTAIENAGSDDVSVVETHLPDPR
jgi:hypothetical protein